MKNSNIFRTRSFVETYKSDIGENNSFSDHNSDYMKNFCFNIFSSERFQTLQMRYTVEEGLKKDVSFKDIIKRRAMYNKIIPMNIASSGNNGTWNNHMYIDSTISASNM